MADQATLISLPKKALKKVIREGKLSSLIAFDEGYNYFDSYMVSHQELKYWEFFKAANEIVKIKDSSQTIKLAEDCFKKHIAIEADPDDRVVRLVNRSEVDNIEKAIINQDSTRVTSTFQNLKDSALDFLNQNIFPTLIPQLHGSLAKSSTCVVI